MADTACADTAACAAACVAGGDVVGICDTCPKPAGKGKGKGKAKDASAPKKERAGKGKAGKGKGKGGKLKAKAAEAAALADQAVAENKVPSEGVAVVYIEKETTAAAPQLRVVERVVRKRKRLDVTATLEKYRERMSAANVNWADLHGKWLSDYKLFTNEPDRDNSGHHGHVLMELAKAHGSTPAGLCAENKKAVKTTNPDGSVTKVTEYVQSTLPDGTTRATAAVVYIGAANRFTGQDASPWSITSADHVYQS